MAGIKRANKEARERSPADSGDADAEDAARRRRKGRAMEVRFVAQRASVETSYRVVTSRSLQQLARRAGMDQAALARFLGISPKTLVRRARKGVLDEAESMKTEMLANTFDEARCIMGDEGQARGWLTSAIVSLDGLRPIDHLDTVDGYERVRETLTKIEYGMY